MRLTDNERLILSRLGLNALAPIAERARDCGLKEHTVRNSIRRLIQRSVLQVRPLINFHLLDLVPFRFYFSLNKTNSARHYKVLERLLKIDPVLCVEELAGEYEFCTSGCATSFFDVERFISEISEVCQVSFSRRSLSCSSGEFTLTRDYLESLPCKKRPKLSTPFDVIERGVDQLDRSILEQLISGPYSSCRQLAKQLRLPPETVRVRLKRLESMRVIAGWTYQLSRAALGVHSYRVMLTLEHLGASTVSEIMEWAENNPHTTEIRRCLGDWDIELSMETEGPEQFVNLLQGWLGNCSDQVGQTRMLSVLRSHEGPGLVFGRETEEWSRAVA